MGWETCSAAVWPLVVQLAMDATILLGAASVACLIMRRASAALRHGVWTVAVVGLLILPGLRVALPDVPLRRLVLVDTSAEMPPSAVNAPAIVEPAADIMTASQAKMPGSVAGPSEVADDDALAPPVFAPRSVNDYADPAAELTTADPSPHPTVAKSTPNRFARFFQRMGLIPWPGVLVGLWAAGAAWGLAMLVGMLVRTGWLLRRAVVVDDPRWNAPAVELAARLGLRRPVTIVKGDRTTIPSTAGWLRARIILPPDHARWPDDLRRVVLSHELTHVARYDVLWQTIARAVAVFYWFHPLMWFAIRRLRWEREVACDDAVLRLGERPSSYAEHLLGFAAALAGQPSLPSAVVAMATRRPIETRIRNVLHPTANRAPVGVREACILIGAASLILLAAGVLRAVDVPDAIPDKSSTTASTTNNAGSDIPRKDAVEPPLVASPSIEFPKRRGPFTVELPGGAIFEVLGLTSHPSEGKSWWKPDGSPLATPPRGPDKLKHPGRVHPNDGQIAREIDVRIDIPKGGKNLLWFVPGVRASASGPFYTMDRGHATSRAFVVDNSCDMVTVLIDYPTAPWKTIYTTKGLDSTSYTGRVDDNLVVNLEIAPAAEARNGEVILSVAHDAVDYYVRVVAIGMDGKEHRKVWSTSNRSRHFGQVVTHFRNLKLDEIKSFRIECRPRRWIEFHNVSLNPGHATKVEIMTSEGPLLSEELSPSEEGSSPSMIDKADDQAAPDDMKPMDTTSG